MKGTQDLEPLYRHFRSGVSRREFIRQALAFGISLSAAEALAVRAEEDLMAIALLRP